MASKPPIFLVDNAFEGVNLYPLALRSSSGTLIGTDVRNVANYRRERDAWQAATSGASTWISSDLGAGITTTADSLFFDRGHNLWGRTIKIVQSADGTGTPVLTRAVPAFGAVGGDPMSTFAVTEEGALWTLFPEMSASRYWSIVFVDSFQPIVTGVILGKSVQLLTYPTSLDEDAAGRKVNTRDSDAGWRASDRAYPYATLQVPIEVVGATEYDNQIRTMKRLLFERNQPTVICMNYGLHSERARLYQYDGNTFSFGTQKVYRRGTFPFRELNPLIG